MFNNAINDVLKCTLEGLTKTLLNMKINKNLPGLLLSTMLLFTACSTAEKQEPIDMANVKAEIQAMEDAYAAGEKAKDANAVAAYYSEDAISYSRNSQPDSGRDAIRDRIAADIANDTTGNYSVYKVVDVFAEGNMAVEIGSWTQFDTSGAELENGHYMSFFQKNSEGKYECVRDMNASTKAVSSGM